MEIEWHLSGTALVSPFKIEKPVGLCNLSHYPHWIREISWCAHAAVIAIKPPDIINRSAI